MTLKKTITPANALDFQIASDEVLMVHVGNQTHNFRTAKEFAAYLGNNGLRVAWVADGKTDGHRIFNGRNIVGHINVTLARKSHKP